ncbi:hypothetical protein [Streptomyces sp. NPDC051310]|uniref:hypothetical protein n=1 Tax=Streptomyces sp. NPDC051310 TaxID=3365649 RepID=UPI0037A44806
MPDRRRQSTESTDENNPFAPPPEGRPDQPWQPRRPENDGADGDGRGDDDTAGGRDRPERPAWGSQWSPRQPGRSSGGFGARPNRDQQGGGASGDQQGPALRWDPTDPAQRRARYALLSGMWGFFFAIFDFPEIALLLGALALYWGISSLRAKPAATAAGGGTAVAPAGAAPASGASAPAAPAATGSRPQRTAAVSGLVTAVLALTIVAVTFTVQLAYRDYYACVDDALTRTGQVSCNELLPEPLRGVFGVKE